MRNALFPIPSLFLVCLLALAGPLNPALAEAPMDREALLELIDQRVEQRLQSDDFLQRQIEQGIEDYVRKQRTAAAERQQRDSADKARNVRPVDVESDHVYGNREAVISLIEYSDFECPYCKRFHATAKQLVDGSGGRINWVYRHFPLSFHNPGAQKQAEASECAASIGGNDAFWQFTDRIYERTRAGGKGFPLENLVPLAVEIGLPEGRFAECLNSGAMAARVQADFDNGQAAGINGTPGNILVNNQTGQIAITAGAVPLSNLVRLADQLMQ